MRFTVEQFLQTNAPFEGEVPHMYLDRKGLVSCGVGNLIEPASLGAGYPWLRQDGSRASFTEYMEDWTAVNSRADLAEAGWVAAGRVCKLHLSHEAIRDLCQQKLLSNEIQLRKLLSNYDSMCADAQMFLHCWAWAVGPASPYPRMMKHLRANKYLSAVDECDITPKVGTIIIRNLAHKQMLTNAFYVEVPGGLDPNVLVYPGSAVSSTESYDHTAKGVQLALDMLGYCIAIDGKHTDDYLAKVKLFQRSMGLTPDGVVGPLTYERLDHALRHR